MSRRNPHTRLFALGIALAALSNACTGFGPSKDEAKQLVALSLSSDADLQCAAFTGTFCESDDGRRLRAQSQAGVAVPSNAYAFGRMADNGLLKTLIANGYVDVKEETLAPDEGEERHPSCGKRDVCARCPAISRYYVATYELTPKGKDLFLVTPIAEGDFMRLYNSDTIVPFDDVQQALGDDMPLTISVTIGTKAFDITRVITDAGPQSHRSLTQTAGRWLASRAGRRPAVAIGSRRPGHRQPPELSASYSTSAPAAGGRASAPSSWRFQRRTTRSPTDTPTGGHQRIGQGCGPSGR
jgi:hypothetical protein